MGVCGEEGDACGFEAEGWALGMHAIGGCGELEFFFDQVTNEQGARGLVMNMVRCEVRYVVLPVKTSCAGGFFQMSVLASAAKVSGVCILVFPDWICMGCICFRACESILLSFKDARWQPWYLYCVGLYARLLTANATLLRTWALLHRSK